jgi:hypothetical protein
MQLYLSPNVFQTTSTDQWLTGNFQTTPNQVNFMDTIGNEIYLNFFKIEPGTIFTGWSEPLEATILDQCKRYFQKSYGSNVDPGVITNSGASLAFRASTNQDVYELITKFNTSMRSIPDVTWYSPVSGAANNIYYLGTGSDISVSLSGDANSEGSGFPRSASGSFGIVGDGVSAHYTADAELP